jgi:hypothetical protein
MTKRIYYLPKSYRIGRAYYYQNGDEGKSNVYLSVRLVAYRPHPGELVIQLNGKKKLIHRRYLFSFVDGKGKD